MSAKDKKDAKATLKDMADKVAEPARKAGKAIRETGERAVANSAQISAKMIDQAEANTREAFAAMRAATKAKDLSEVMKIQGDFLRDVLLRRDLRREDVVPRAHAHAAVDRDRAHRRVRKHEAERRPRTVDELGHDRPEVVAVGAEPVQPEDRVARRRCGFELDRRQEIGG